MAQIKEITWTGKQLNIINSLEESNKIFVEGGVRSGKSFLICWLIDWICTRTPGMTALILRKSYESIKTDTHIIFKSNPGFLTPDKGTWADGSRQFNYHNGSKIYFRHAEGAEHLLGITAGLVFFEQVELIAERDFDLIKNTRLSQWGGKNLATVEYLKNYNELINQNKLLYPRNWLFMTANPRAGWVKSRYIDNSEDGLLRFHVSTFDNMENLPEEYIADMSTASDEFKRVYFDGSWEFNSGLVYPEFGDKNIVEPEWEAVTDFRAVKYRTYLAIDPGYSNSKFAVIMAAVLADGRVYVFDEVVKNGKSVQEWEKVGLNEIIDEIKGKFNRYKFKPNINIIDYASNRKELTSGESLSMQFIKAGIPVTNSIKTDEMATIFRIKDLFKNGKIIINSRCRNLIRELGLFRWHEKKINTAVDEDNDCLDCLRYIINSTPRPQTGMLDIKEESSQQWGNRNMYKEWLKTWYGKEPVKKSGFSIKNDTKLDFGL